MAKSGGLRMCEDAKAEDRAADRVRLSQLWTSAYPLVFAFIRSMVRDFHSCEDIMQDVATAVAEKFDKYDCDRPFSAWVVGIARNKVLMHLRTNSSDRHVFDADTAEKLASASIAAESELSERRQALEACAKKLEGRARKVIEMRYARGERPQEIAKSTGMTANAVSILLHRIRRALKDCIERELIGPGRLPGAAQGGTDV